MNSHAVTSVVSLPFGANVVAVAIAAIAIFLWARTRKTPIKEPWQPWETLARVLLAEGRQIFVLLDSTERVLFASDRLLSVTGHVAAQIIGKPWADVAVPPEDCIRWRRVDITPGADAYVALVGEDLTERRERARQERRIAFQERILDSILSCVFVANPNGRVIYANAALRDRSGIVDAEIGEETDDGHPLTPSLAAFRPAYQEAYDAMSTRRFRDVCVRRADGRDRLYEGWMIPLFDGDNYAGMMCTCEDVTDRLAAEEELREFESRLAKLIDSVPGLVWVADAETRRMTCVSRRAEEIFGYPIAEWLQPNFFIDHLHPDDRDMMEAAVVKLLADGQRHEGEFRVFAADGRIVWLHGQASVFREAGRTWMQGAAFDVTAVHEAHDALRRSSALVRAMFEQSVMGIVVRDRAGNVVDQNSAFRRIDAGCISSDQLRGDYEALWSGATSEIDKETRCDGRWYRIRASLVAAGDGEAPVSVAVAEDITERKRAEKELRASRDEMREFVSLTTDWVWECDASARYTYASGRVRDVLGYEPGDVIGKTACDLTSPEERERTRAVLGSLLAAPRPFSLIEVTGQHRDGRLVHLEVSGVPLLDNDGRLAGYRGVVRDVTERETHRRMRQRLATAIEYAGDVVMITDREGRIEYVNPAFEAVTGHRREDVLGSTPGILKSDTQSEAFYEELWGELAAGRKWAGSFVNRRRDGQLYNADATIAPIFDDRRAITGYVSVQRDVTETLALIERLRTATEMERFGRLVGAVAHEVRNPLNAIQAAAAALELDFGDDPDVRPLFEIVRGQVGRLAQLMRDLLIIGRPVSDVSLQPHALADVLLEAIELWRTAHSEEDHHLRVTTSGKCVVRANPLRIQQVILNLLDNALQHSPPESEIVVTLDRTERDCRFVVRDSGDGVKAENLTRIFEPFFTTRRSGTGLGLTLVRSIVEQHGGTVSLRNNEPPPGCTVEVRLPVFEKEGGVPCSRES